MGEVTLENELSVKSRNACTEIMRQSVCGALVCKRADVGFESPPQECLNAPALWRNPLSKNYRQTILEKKSGVKGLFMKKSSFT